MRLFVAVTLSENAIKAITDAAGQVSALCVSGNFSRHDNYHLTLAFIGEAPAQSLSKIKGAIPPPPKFSLEISGAGKFRRSSGDILWAGVKTPQNLLVYREVIAKNLRALGYAIDERFDPHITLAREAIMKPDADLKTVALSFTEEKPRVCLMKSERIHGQLTYTEVYSPK